MRSTETIEEVKEGNTAIDTISYTRHLILTQRDEPQEQDRELLGQSEKTSKRNQSTIKHS